MIKPSTFLTFNQQPPHSYSTGLGSNHQRSHHKCQLSGSAAIKDWIANTSPMLVISVDSLAFVSFVDLWAVVTPAHARPAPSPTPLLCVCCHVKTLWVHTNNQPYQQGVHLLAGNLWPLTLEVRPHAGQPAVEAPRSCVHVRETDRWASTTVQYYKDNETMVMVKAAHSAQTLFH